MSLFVSSLNSGSNGNCYYVGSSESAVLIDAGISCRETEKRMKRLGLSLKSVKAIFISHEHGDHIHGCPAISKKYKIPVYITEETLRQSRSEIVPDHIRVLHPYDVIDVGDLRITSFPKLHDACDPLSFVVSRNGVRVGVFTDLGEACENVTHHFSQCHAAFLEANYDDDMLNNGFYPWHLKERIRGQRGHLSNVQARKLFDDHRAPHLSHLFLAHLSQDNNSPKLVKDLFERNAEATEIIIAGRRKETRLYHIRGSEGVRRKPVRQREEILQLGLFA